MGIEWGGEGRCTRSTNSERLQELVPGAVLETLLAGHGRKVSADESILKANAGVKAGAVL